MSLGWASGSRVARVRRPVTLVPAGSEATGGCPHSPAPTQLAGMAVCDRIATFAQAGAHEVTGLSPRAPLPHRRPSAASSLPGAPCSPGPHPPCFTAASFHLLPPWDPGLSQGFMAAASRLSGSRSPHSLAR